MKKNGATSLGFSMLCCAVLTRAQLKEALLGGTIDGCRGGSTHTTVEMPTVESMNLRFESKLMRGLFEQSIRTNKISS